MARPCPMCRGEPVVSANEVELVALNSECPICLTEIPVDESVLLTCRHQFCLTCHESWQATMPHEFGMDAFEEDATHNTYTRHDYLLDNLIQFEGYTEGSIIDLPEELEYDLDFARMVLASHGPNAVHDRLSHHFWNQRDFVMIAVTNNGYALGYASEVLRADRGIVLAAVRNSPNTWVFEFADRSLFEDRVFVLEAVQLLASQLRYASSALRDDREVVLAAIQESALSLEYASENLRADREVVTTAVRRFGIALDDASEEFKADRDIVEIAVRSTGDAFQYASDTLRSDRAFVIAMVAIQGSALKHASDELRNDREVVLTAIRNSHYSINYASETLQTDPSMIEEAQESRRCCGQ